jgi:hypothetical protein
MSSNDVFGHKFNAASSWCELAKNNPANKAWIEKEKKVWQLFATTNAVTKTNTAIVSNTVADTCTSATVDTTTKN